MTIDDGSNNIFADLSLPEPELRLAKATIAIYIEDLIAQRGITQTAAAQITGLAQPDVSDIVNGKLRGFTLERLLSAVVAMGSDVVITLQPKADAEAHMVVDCDTVRGDSGIGLEEDRELVTA